MKTLFFFLLIVLVLHLSLFAQPPAGGGGIEYVQDFPCLTDEQREQIQAQLQENIRILQEQGILPRQYSPQSVLFEFPLAPAPELTDYGFHGISNFVDHDPAYPNHIQDYFCGVRSYDLPSGYNHQGTDFFTTPFPWYKMDYDLVYVVAAAPGVIIHKQDGYYDRNCGFTGAPWNAVYVQHADGSVAWYGHMKNGSLTPKGVGDGVALGEYLGVVGSSGNSTGPHLHFEVYDQFNNLIDPYQGSCNSMNSDSWWIDQKPYYDSAINALMTHSAAPVLPSCPQQEILNKQDHFMPGETVYTAAYYRDQLNTQVSTYYLIAPDSSVFSTWTHSSDAPHYAWSYWYWYWFFPIGIDEGVWTFKVEYENKTYVHHFTVGATGVEEQEPVVPVTTELYQNYPNPFNPVTTISFDLPHASPKGHRRHKQARITLHVYDMTGKKVKTLINGHYAAGHHTLLWDGTDDSGQPVAGGVYLYRLETGSYIAVRKMVLLR